MNRTTPLLFLGLLILGSTLAIPFVHAQSVVATVTVGNAPYTAAYDSAKGEVFVANGNNNTVSVISDSSNTVVANVTMGNIPLGVAYDPAKGRSSRQFMVTIASQSYQTPTTPS